jgi:hypothetical protein
MSSISIISSVFQNTEIPKKVNLDSLYDIMLTKDKMDSITSGFNHSELANTKKDVELVTNNDAEKDVIIETRKQKDEYIEPRQHDTLFWCLYIIHHGYNDYMQIDRNYGVKELEEKQKIFNFIKANPSKMKNTNYKMTNVALQEIQSEMMTVQKQTSMTSMIAMLVYYNINLLIIDASEKTMLEFWVNKEDIPSMNTKTTSDSAATYVLHKSKMGKYKLQMENIATHKIYEMKEKYVVLDSYLKPLKSMTNYKVEELEEIAKKLGVYNENKKYKKAELYQLVADTLQSFMG